MKEIDFMGSLHKSTSRDYLARVNDKEYPKPRAAKLAKNFDYDYWDGDRRICYGGYKYIEGRWTKVAESLINYYKLDNKSKILDIGCGKGFLMYELLKINPSFDIYGIDISDYAIRNSKDEISGKLTKGCASNLPWTDNYFDLVISINSLHCLSIYKLFSALKEMERVGSKNKYLCVESYRNEVEKANLLYWQVTCECFFSPEEWYWIYEKSGYHGDYSYIYFE
tara:strand:+ start:3394 stop:4065 length:672 start_codon:yes stop_codon:yes gene_type:complete